MHQSLDSIRVHVNDPCTTLKIGQETKSRARVWSRQKEYRLGPTFQSESKDAQCGFCFPFSRDEGCVAYSCVAHINIKHTVPGETLLTNYVEADRLRRSRCNIWDDPQESDQVEV